MATAIAPAGRSGLVRVLAAGIIARARRRARRRRALIAAGLAVVTLGIAGHGFGGGPAGPLATKAELVAPAAVLAGSPYMGVACPEPNSIACDRLGLAVWLRRPADSVTATVAGRPLRLDWSGDRPPGSRSARPTARTAFDGFLQPAGLVGRLGVRPDAGPHGWLGTGTPVTPVVELRVAYPDGSVVLTRLAVPLSTGWG